MSGQEPGAAPVPSANLEPGVLVSASEPQPHPVAPPSEKPTRIELLAALAAATASAVFVGFLSRRLWFTVDAWDFITQRVLRLDSLLVPHQDHLAPWPGVWFQFVYPRVGLDYWPWYPLVRYVAYPTLAIVVWWVVRRRGTGPGTAGAALAVLLVLASQAWMGDAHFGNAVALAAIIGSAHLVTLVDPQPRRIVGVTLLLLIAVSACSVGVIGAAGIATVLIATREWRWWPVAIPLAMYAAWFASWRGSNPAADWTWESPIQLAVHAATILGHGFTEFLGMPDVLVAPLFVLGGGWMIFLVVTKRFGRFDWMLILTLGAYLGAVILSRIVNGLSEPLNPRFGHHVVILLTPVLLPHVPNLLTLRPQLRRLAGVGTVVAVSLNIANLASRLNEAGPLFQERSATVRTAGALVAAGEPVFEGRRLFYVTGNTFSADTVRWLLDDGWEPQPEAEYTERVRAQLRVNVWPAGSPAGDAPVVGLPVVDGCVEAAGVISATVFGPGSVTVEATPESIVEVRWSDEYGFGRAEVPPEIMQHPSRPGLVSLSFVDPPTEAALEVRAGPNELLRMCGVSSARDPD